MRRARERAGREARRASLESGGSREVDGVKRDGVGVGRAGVREAMGRRKWARAAERDLLVW